MFIAADVVKAPAENDKAVSALIMSAFDNAGKSTAAGPSKFKGPVTVAIAPKESASVVKVEASLIAANAGKEISSAVITVAAEAAKAPAVTLPAVIVTSSAAVAAKVTAEVAVIVVAPVTLVA